MPAAKTKNAPGLSIHLTPHPPTSPDTSTPSTAPLGVPSYNPTYYPSSPITGTITLSPSPSTNTSVTSGIADLGVTLTLYARSKVKVVKSDGQSRSEYRSRANLFRVERRLLHDEGFEGKDGGWEWEFEMMFPERVDGRHLRHAEGKGDVKFEPRDGFLSNTASNIVDEQGLPASMRCYHGAWGRQVWGYIEYVLVATVEEQPEVGKGGGGIFGRAKRRVSTRVLDFGGPRQGVIEERGLVKVEHCRLIKLGKLVEGGTSDEEVDVSNLNIGEKSNDTETKTTPTPQSTRRSSSSIFSRLSSPFSRSTYVNLAITITYPSTNQVNHPQPIPFIISTSPTTPPTTITPITLTLTLTCTTSTRAHGFRNHDERDSKTVEISLCENRPIFPRLTLSATEMNLGELLDLRLTGAQVGRVHEDPLTGSFKTYNIARTFGLKYMVELEVSHGGETGGGNKERFRGEVPRGGIRVVGIADCLKREGGEELPSYGDLEELDGVDEDDGDEGDEGESFEAVNDEKRKDGKIRGDRVCKEDGEELPRYER